MKKQGPGRRAQGAREAVDLVQRLAELCEAQTHIAMQDTSSLHGGGDGGGVPPSVLSDTSGSKVPILIAPDEPVDGGRDQPVFRSRASGQGGPSDLEVALMVTAVAEAVARETNLMVSLSIDGCRL
jgi:hypothetical protein